MNDLHRALSAIAARTRKPGPTAAQWVEALAVIAAADPVPGHYRLIDLTVGGAVNVRIKPWPSDERSDYRSRA